MWGYGGGGGRGRAIIQVYTEGQNTIIALPVPRHFIFLVTLISSSSTLSMNLSVGFLRDSIPVSLASHHPDLG